MRGLQALVVGMGVLIVAGVVVLGFTIAHRMAAPALPAAATILAEPSGTHIVAMAPVADRVGLLLQGGGPDRVVVFDPRTGQAVTLIKLAP